MEVTNCTDINGVSLDTIQFNLDGTVVGLIDVNGTETESNLSYDCCTAQGYLFDPNDTKCYWASTCLNGGTYNIVLDPEGNTGALFQVDEVEQGLCHLELSFKFLLRVDCDILTGYSLKQLLETLKLTVSIEKVIFDESLIIPNNLEEVASQDLFNITDIFTFLSGNINTGILLNGNCTTTTNNFLNDLSPNEGIVNDYTLNSDWYEFSMIVDDPTILETIYNERLKVSINGNILTNFAILLDDIQLNRVCDVITPPAFLDEECPKFELKRVIDNKKSWVRNEITELREFDLSRRETSYSINHEQLSINTKEIDLAINPSQAIENSIVDTVITNECLLAPKSGCTSGTHECVDLRPLITTEIVDINDLVTQLIDVKNRKTISTYPTLDLLYYRYLNSQDYCGTASGLNSESVNLFVDLLGTYWSDLIEQVVPATTIWGSSLVNGDNAFSVGTNKFVYRKGTTFFCRAAPTYPVPSPVSGGTANPSVLTEDITDNDALGDNTSNIITCATISTSQLNFGSEFIGTINVTGDPDGPVSGDTIFITETIEDNCDKFEKC